MFKKYNFNRLNRDNLSKDVKNYIEGKESFTDFNMPRPYSLYKNKINKVFLKAFNENNQCFKKFSKNKENEVENIVLKKFDN